MKNIKKYCQKPLSIEQYDDLLDEIRFLHLKKSNDEYKKAILAFKKNGILKQRDLPITTAIVGLKVNGVNGKYSIILPALVEYQFKYRIF